MGNKTHKFKDKFKENFMYNFKPNFICPKLPNNYSGAKPSLFFLFPLQRCDKHLKIEFPIHQIKDLLD